jgi:integrase
LPLTDTKLRALKDPGKHFDGGGLYLEVTPAGGRYWRLKYRFAGKEKRLAFGVYPAVTLKDARNRRDEARKILDSGNDPGAMKQAQKAQGKEDAANTFERVALEWITQARGKWSEAHEARTLANLKADVFPALGARSIASITARDVKALVRRVEERGGELASRTMMRIRAVFRFAMVHERIASNPMQDLIPGEVLKARNVAPRAALPQQELPGYLKKLSVFAGDPCTAHGLRLLMLTAVRPGELRGARWAEIDTEAAIWRIPAERMKMRTEHVVPLSRQALDVLEAVKPLAGSNGLVFPSPYYPSKSLSENTFNSALARMGYKGIATAHGFRALFSTVANESGWNPDAVERQLAHMERNKIRAAYHRSTYLEDRKKMMQWWADYLDGVASGGKVVPLKRGNKAAA